MLERKEPRSKAALFRRGTVYKRREEEARNPLFLIREGREFIIGRHGREDVYSRCIDNRVPFIALGCLGASIDRRKAYKPRVSERSTLVFTSLSRFNASFRGWNHVDFLVVSSFLLLLHVVHGFLLFHVHTTSYPRSYKRFTLCISFALKERYLNIPRLAIRENELCNGSFFKIVGTFFTETMNKKFLFYFHYHGFICAKLT